MGRPRRLGSGLAEGRDRGVDDPWVPRADRLRSDAETGDHAGSEGLHKNIGGIRKPEERLPVLILLKVEEDRLLVAMGVSEPDRDAVGGAVAHLANRLASRGFDLDDLGAVIAHHFA